MKLLSHPEHYDRKKIQVIGYYAKGYELSGLFLTKADAKAGNIQAAVWVNLENKLTVRSDLVDMKLRSGTVILQGTFYYNKDGSGHMNFWPAEIGKITLLRKR